MGRANGKQFFQKFSPRFIIPLFICVSGCSAERRTKTVRLVITTLQYRKCEMTISDPSIHDVPLFFLARAANDFAAQYAGAPVEPDIKTFNYVDEVGGRNRQFRYRNRAGYSFGAFFNLRLH